MNELALFAGAGGGILGEKLLGWTTVGAVEIEKYPREVLMQRQRDGILEPFPIWDDICTFDGRPWKGAVDIISGGFPCQDISAAGKGAGIDGERSGLWGEMARIIGEVRPRFALVENSPMLTLRGLHRVFGDLAEMGYNARWCVLGADDAGAPHRRKRIWILAYSDTMWESQQKRTEQDKRGWIGNSSGEGMGNTISAGLEEFTGNEPDRDEPGWSDSTADGSISTSGIRWWDIDPADLPDTEHDGQHRAEWNETEQGSNRQNNGLSIRDYQRPTKPVMGRVAHGVDSRVDRLKAIGNGQVPAVAALAFVILSEGLI